MRRTGALLLPLSVILFVVSTAVFHPHKEDPMNHEAVFMEYSETRDWIAIHFAQWVAVLLLCGGLTALYHSLQSGVASRFAFIGVILTAATFTMLQAVDGVALKWAVDAWAQASGDEKNSLFAAALALRWTEYSFQSYSNILLGLTLALFSLAMRYDSAYPRWLGWIAAGSGAAWIIHGAMVSSRGLFDSIPRLTAIILFAIWAFTVSMYLWRSGSAGRSADHN